MPWTIKANNKKTLTHKGFSLRYKWLGINIIIGKPEWEGLYCKSAKYLIKRFFSGQIRLTELYLNQTLLDLSSIIYKGAEDAVGFWTVNASPGHSRPGKRSADLQITM